MSEDAEAKVLGPLPDDVLALDELYPGMALADQVRAYTTKQVDAERERWIGGARVQIPTRAMEQEIQAHVRMAVTAERERCARRTTVSDATVMPVVGDYVLATKWGDGDPGDPWAVGFYAGTDGRPQDPRHIVLDSEGNSIRPGGFRRVGRITPEFGLWLLEVAAKQLEASPPGSVNLWTMMGARATPELGSESPR